MLTHARQTLPIIINTFSVCIHDSRLLLGHIIRNDKSLFLQNTINNSILKLRLHQLRVPFENESYRRGFVH